MTYWLEVLILRKLNSRFLFNAKVGSRERLVSLVTFFSQFQPQNLSILTVLCLFTTMLMFDLDNRFLCIVRNEKIFKFDFECGFPAVILFVSTYSHFTFTNIIPLHPQCTQIWKSYYNCGSQIYRRFKRVVVHMWRWTYKQRAFRAGISITMQIRLRRHN